MKQIHFLSFVYVILISSAELSAQERWEKIKTIEKVYSLYPERIDQLFQSLDLDREGLQTVKEAVNRGQVVEACNALLAYYRTSNNAKYLQRAQPHPSNKVDSHADSITRDLFIFYELPDRVPRTSNGQLDWTHQGPDNDIEWAWALNRHGHLDILLEAYLKTGNRAYAMTIDDHLQDWALASLPYPGVKSSTAQWRGLEVALRAKNWVRVFYGLLNTDYLTPATRLLMLSSLPDHVHYMSNFHAPSGNWLTMEMSGLAMVATAWPEFKQSRDWVAYAKEKMLEGLKDQVYPDGVQKELTSHYHQVALYNFDHFLEISDQAGESLPEDYTRQLEQMQHYIASTVRPTGHGILNNDSDNRYNRDAILEAAARYKREDWMFIASNGKKGKRPQGPPSIVFPWAGQVVMRSGYDVNAHWGFFDIGPWGTGHQHNDKLHISITAYGRDLLVDGGRFAYRGELAKKFRGYATGSESHNVLLIDGAGQDAGPVVATAALPEEAYRITEEFDYAAGSFGKFKGIPDSVQHTRAVFYLRAKFWVVVDHIATDRPRKVEALWHWHPDLTVVTESDGVVSTDVKKGNLRIIPVGKTGWIVRHVKGQEEPAQGWYSEKYNKAEPNVATIYATNIEGPSSFVWILQPSAGKSSPLKGEILSQDKDKVRVRIRDEKLNQWEILVPFSNSAIADYTFKPALGVPEQGGEGAN